MTTYLASVTAANYVRLDDHFVYAPGDTMPVTHYVYPALEAKARIDFNITVPALAFFSETFGLYPFIAEKYGVALCPIGGGMEHQTLTSYGSSLVTGDHYYDWVFVHELAHMWFGDMITCKDWTHIWLNEGFASYGEALWFEHLQGPAKLRTYMESEDHPDRWNGPVLRDPDVTTWTTTSTTSSTTRARGCSTCCGTSSGTRPSSRFSRTTAPIRGTGSRPRRRTTSRRSARRATARPSPGSSTNGSRARIASPTGGRASATG